MPKVTVDGTELDVPDGATVLQACELAGKEIPRFCYHERLSIAGNCRMCLVEVKPGPPKPQASCALPATDGQEIRTDSQMVKTAREGVMEFLLINHPLDCPICDQGGECDLQDQAMMYGRGGSRYDMNKRAVTEKYMGPLIKTIMTRCIHCTRCVRFSEEIAGVDEIGALYRGEDMQITTYLEQAASHELSANVIDLCPVGALTSRPYAFEARPWELRQTMSIDVSDAVGANITLYSKGREVMRALPRVNDDVNEEWLSDKGRYQVDGLVRRRLDKVWIRRKGKLQQADWDEAFKAIAKAKPGASIAAVAGDLVDCETMFAAKSLLKACGSELVEGRQTGMSYDVGNLAAVNFNGGFCRYRNGRCHPDRGQPGSARSGAGQCAPAQGGIARGQGVRGRAGMGNDLSGDFPRHRSFRFVGSAGCSWRCFQCGRTTRDHPWRRGLGAGCACASFVRR